MDEDPHADTALERAGATLADADRAVILLHGRGAAPTPMLQLVDAPEDVALLAPAAADRTWYPESFLAPRAENEPHLSSALRRVEQLIDDIEEAGVDTDAITLAGFSQGACLALEYAARHPARYDAVFGFSGGLIGEDVDGYDGSMAGTPVFLGCSRDDPHIPLERVDTTADVFRDMDAHVTMHTWPGSDHTITAEERKALAAHLGAEPV